MYRSRGCAGPGQPAPRSLISDYTGNVCNKCWKLVSGTFDSHNASHVRTLVDRRAGTKPARSYDKNGRTNTRSSKSMDISRSSINIGKIGEKVHS